MRIFKLDAMSKKTGKKRDAPIPYRPPAALRDEFHSRVEKSGLSTSAFLTKSVFGNDAPRQSRRPAIEQKLLAQLLAQAAQIREELKRVSGPDSNPQAIEAATEELRLIRVALFKEMGRQP